MRQRKKFTWVETVNGREGESGTVVTTTGLKCKSCGIGYNDYYKTETLSVQSGVDYKGEWLCPECYDWINRLL